MAKPRLYLCNRLNPEGPGDGDNEEGGAATGRERGGEGGGGKGKERNTYTHPPTRRSRSRHREGHPASAAGAKESEEQELEGAAEGEEEDRETPRGAPVEVPYVGGDATPPEENADLLGFTPEHAHLLLQGVYGDLPHHNNGSHLGGGIADDAAWQSRWRRLAAQSASWYATPYGAVGRRFTEILAAE